MPLEPAEVLSDLAQQGPASYFPRPETPVTFNFDQGLAAEETFPIADLQRVMTTVLDRDRGRALEYVSLGYDPDRDKILYPPTQGELALGYPGLRSEVARWIGRTQGVSGLDVDHVILTSGSVQAIALAVSALLNPGEGALVEKATFPYAMRFMQMRGAEVRAVEIDEHGLVPESLVQRLQGLDRDGIRPKLLYVIPTFQLPTCVVMPEDRRRRLLEIAEEWNLVVLEDSIYSDLRYGGDPVPSLLSLDTGGRVLQSHGFSKNLAPGLRLGWITAAPALVRGLAAVRQDLGVSQWTSRAMELFLIEGLLDPHIAAANQVYRRKRDVAVDAVRRHCGDLVTFDVPDGGFYLWLRMADNVDWAKAQHDAAERGVFCRPGERFLGERDGQAFLRLAYSHAADEEIERGIAVLGEAITSNVR